MGAGKHEALGSNWGSCLIPPEELEICKRCAPHDASLPAQDWKLGSGAFGTVRQDSTRHGMDRYLGSAAFRKASC